MTPQQIALAYLQTWNATDSQLRAALLAEHWTAGATYVDPLMQADGVEQIAGLVDAVHARFPGFRFQLRGIPDGFGPFVRLAWSLGVPGEEAPIDGSDLIELQDGRIARVIGFIDRAPASA